MGCQQSIQIRKNIKKESLSLSKPHDETNIQNRTGEQTNDIIKQQFPTANQNLSNQEDLHFKAKKIDQNKNTDIKVKLLPQANSQQLKEQKKFQKGTLQHQEQLLTLTQYIEYLFKIIKQNKNLHFLLTSQIFQNLQKQFKIKFWSKQSKARMLKILEDYIIFSCSQLNSQIKNQTKYKTIDKFGEQYGKQISKVKVFQYINYNRMVESLQFSRHFIQKLFKFENVLEIANNITNLCRIYSPSIAYLSYFFVIICQKNYNNENSFLSYSSLQGLLKNKAIQLKNLFSVKEANQRSSKILGSSKADTAQQMSKIKNYAEKYTPIKFFITGQNKEEQLNNQILKLVEIAKKNLEYFNDILYRNCIDNEGFEFKSNLKLYGRQNIGSLNRVKQKMFKDQIEKNFHKNINIQKCKTLYQSFDLQRQNFRNSIKQIYQNLTEIPFTVTDLLRGKCMFHKINHINNAAQAIIKRVEEQSRTNKGKDIKIVEIDNRLNKITKDLVLKIKIQDIVCQFQMVIFFDHVQNQIHHKMYEITRSKIFSPFYLLYEWNDKSWKQFYSQISEMAEKLPNGLGFSHLNKYNLSKFVNFLKHNNPNMQIQTKIPEIRYLNKKKINQLLQKTNIPQNINSSLEQKQKLFLQSAECFYNYNQTAEASKMLQNITENSKYITNKLKLLGKMMLKIASKPHYHQALKYFQQCLQIQQKTIGQNHMEYLETVNNIAEAYQLLDNFKQAIKFYEFSIKILQKSQKKNYDAFVMQLNNMGKSYFKLNQLDKASNYFKQALELIQKQEAKSSSQYAMALANLGNVEKKKQDYKQAIKIYIESLDILENDQGKQTLNYSQVLNCIGEAYYCLKDFKQSLQYFTKSLSIMQKKNQKQRIMYAIISKNIGETYFHVKKNAQALEYLKKAYDIFKKTQNTQNFDCAITMRKIGEIYTIQKNFDQAFSYLQKGLNTVIYLKGKWCLEACQFWEKLGEYYQKQGILQDTLLYYFLILQIHEEMNQKNRQIYKRALQKISYIYWNQKRFTYITLTYEKQLQLCKRCQEQVKKKKGTQSEDYCNLIWRTAQAYHFLKNKVQSVKLFGDSLAIQEKLTEKQSQKYINLLRNTGDIYKKTQQYQMALKYYEQCFQISQKNPQSDTKNPITIQIANMCFYIGSEEYLLKKYQSALNYYNRAMPIFKGHKKCEEDFKRVQKRIQQLKQKIPSA